MVEGVTAQAPRIDNAETALTSLIAELQELNIKRI